MHAHLVRRPEEINTVAMFYEMGLTYSQIARIMGLSRTTVRHWLNGRLPRRKHERSIVLAAWQYAITRRQPEALIRGLIHSDGCRYMNRIRHASRSYVYPSYSFANVSSDIKQIFCEHLDLLDIEWRRNDPKEIVITRRASVAKLDEFVGPKR
jgi:transcriptional regulator with XRE-family HTH domain